MGAESAVAVLITRCEWDLSSGECIRIFKGHSSSVKVVSWSSDGSRICSGGSDRTVRVWDVSCGDCIRTLKGHFFRVSAVSWSSDGSRICSGSDDETVRVWKVSSGECIRTLEGHSSLSAVAAMMARCECANWQTGNVCIPLFSNFVLLRRSVF